MQTQAFPHSSRTFTDTKWPQCGSDFWHHWVSHVFFDFLCLVVGSMGISEIPCWVGKSSESPYVLTSHPTHLILAVVRSTCRLPRGPAPRLAHSGQSQARVCLSNRVFTGLSGSDVLTCPYKWVSLLNTESISMLKRKKIVHVTNGCMVWLS